MSSGVPTNKPNTTTYDWKALVVEAWGDAWLKPDIVYRFSNNRTFRDSAISGGPYTGSATGT